MKRRKIKPDSESIKSLEKAILDLHGCKSTWVKSAQIKEIFGRETAWEGVVQVFDLQSHPTAKRCYVWSHDIEGSKKKFFAVLHQGPIDSPQTAVRAAIVAEYKSKNIPAK